MLRQLSLQLWSQSSTRSNLPIVNTSGSIFDEPKVAGDMRIFYNRNAENVIAQDSSHRVAWRNNEISLVTTPTTEITESNILVFPIPTNDIVNLDFNKTEKQPDLIELYNAQGQLIANHLIQNSFTQVSIKQFDSQVIYARIFRNGNLLEIRKLIKSH